MQQIEDAEDEIADTEARMRWEGGRQFFERWRRGELEPPEEMTDYWGREIRPCGYSDERLDFHYNPDDCLDSIEQDRYSSYDDDFEELGDDQVDEWVRSHGLPGPRIIIR